MKIVLVAQNSSYTHTNPAVRILACELRGTHETTIVETTVNEKGGCVSLVGSLYEKKADMYAFSTYIWNRQEQITCAVMIKRLLPDCITVLGGPEVSFETDDFFEKYPEIDYVIKGEGESAIGDIAAGIYSPHSFVDGGIYGGFSDSDEPYFAHSFSTDDSKTTDGKLVYYESSRGCPYSCSYCLSSVKGSGEKLRFKSPEKVVSEIAQLMSKNIKAIKFVDRTFNADVSRAKLLFSEFIRLAAKYTEDGKYNGPMCHFEICAALLDDETTELLASAPEGLFRFEIGVQTTNPLVLSEIGRRDDTQKILENVRKLRERTNIHVHLDLICGLPGESYESVKSSFDSIYGLCDMLQMGVLKLLPGTSMREKRDVYGMISLDTPPYQVLKTDAVGFSEMRRLLSIAEWTEVFYGGDSGFCESIKYLSGLFDSPFEFYEKLSEFLDAQEYRPSGKKLYSLLLAFYRDRCDGEESCAELLKERLRFDYVVSNQGRPPQEIDRIYREEEAILEEKRKEFIHSLDRERSEFFIPATEAHMFSFDKDGIWIIDRKNHKTKRFDFSL